MRRLPGILLATGATLIVIVALLVSGLRLVLPQLDRFRPQLVEWAQSAAGVPLEIGSLQGRWESFGPTLEIENFQTSLPESDWRVERITLALDVWQSLLHGRWQFRDLTFHQLRLDLNTTLSGTREDGDLLESGKLSDLFLRQFDHFDLRDSHISFLTPSGARAEFSIPQLTWLNSSKRHRAEGLISLSSFNGQHGVVQMRMDLHDDQGVLNNGTLYLQADNIDMKPWFGRWMKHNTGLESADFSLAAWLNVREGDIYSGDVFLRQGTAAWGEGQDRHRLNVDDMVLHVSRQENGWQLAVPALNMATDGVPWPTGRLAALWLPKNEPMLGPDRQEELRIRASNLDLARFGALLPLLSTTTPALKERWQSLQPQGRLSTLAVDIPLQQPEKSRFQARWHDVSWQAWQRLPGVDRFSGAVSGSVEHGQLDLGLTNSTLPNNGMFRAPLEISQASGAINWRYNDRGWELWSHGLDVQAKSLWANGDFRYQHPEKGAPKLDILAGLRLTDAADAWRYYPEPFMGKELVDYLSGALKGGQVDNGTLIFAGDPQNFPYVHNEGHFEVWVPVKNATFEFQPGWPALTPLDINLDFANNGLWMFAPQAWLGKVEGKNISAVVPDYAKEKLLVDGELSGPGPEVGNYFQQTPLKSSLGAALEELQLGGQVNGTLHLDIPLAGDEVQASGDIVLNNNSLYIQPLTTTIKNLSGKFHYDNGNLRSETLQANWLDQPITVDFTTEEQESAFQVNVGLQGAWLPSRLPGIPKPLVSQIAGTANWKSTVAVSLPYQGKTTYNVDIDADLDKVSSHLPSPLDKAAGARLPLQVKAKGDLNGFALNGRLGKNQSFNSQWLLKGDAVTLARGRWQTGADALPSLPQASALVLDLPPLDAERWLGLLPSAHSSLNANETAGRFRFPTDVTVRTPELQLLGQRWHDLAISRKDTLSGSEVQARGREIDATLDIPRRGIWRSDIRYLYYNPQWKGNEATNPVVLAEKKSPLNDPGISFEDWPALQINCRQCWLVGQNLGRIQGTLQPEKGKLTLSDGLIDTGKARLTVNGNWQENTQGVRTALKGRLSGASLVENADWFGVDTPLRAGSFDVDYDLYWRGTPWEPDVASLSGILHTRIGKGEIADVGTGQAGQLLRLISFDALLRKLRLDFSDTFGSGFYFDSIRSTAWIKDGVLHTDDMLVDGLEADIAMKGDVDLVRRQVNMEAVIAPEISATVGVAAAFVVNPVVGAAVFAASKVLAPLWNKISLIRYQITGSLDQPKIQEVLREPSRK
ncbi:MULTISPECIES: AsmA2 domain-containing protein YhdP [unclassified Brenneria]|uniref:AsmA2 domain-containing protein YhdP n=1 Tax=unclassified Brenneria TaxID=2634434 RepID=UPI0018F0E37C|nr:AsmA2 domain-containing protein YhdP [Brenneria sp. L3-3C-1]MEE3643738.1 AsmA2 domain-containing protein YhdP [Brenneria sp. L3_3C_1]